jgi:hypothetical protein
LNYLRRCVRFDKDGNDKIEFGLRFASIMRPSWKTIQRIQRFFECLGDRWARRRILQTEKTIRARQYAAELIGRRKALESVLTEEADENSLRSSSLRFIRTGINFDGKTKEQMEALLIDLKSELEIAMVRLQEEEDALSQAVKEEHIRRQEKWGKS